LSSPPGDSDHQIPIRTIWPGRAGEKIELSVTMLFAANARTLTTPTEI
jgi:hypothetical protein